MPYKLLSVMNIRQMKLILIPFIFFVHNLNCCKAQDSEQIDLLNSVTMWADTIGKELRYLAENVTKRSRIIESFKQSKIVFQNGSKLAEDIADRLRVLMAQKEEAVKRIVEKAESLSYNRKAPIFENSTYDYYNSDNITNTTVDPIEEEQLYKDMLERDEQFICEENFSCEEVPYIERKPDYFRNLPLVYHPHFNQPVNLNYSVVKTATSVYDREDPVLNDVRWSEALDFVFKRNYNDDPTLLWQSFAGISGFLRHYPALQWSNEKYDKTFDFRTRAWYLEAISSPKDVIILLDLSGSMWQQKWNTAKFLVNNILDTLGDNDYVNVYLFSNETYPLVECFNYTLMQAHEENLRLLRESLDEHTPYYNGNMTTAFIMAFETLAKYRQTGGQAHCNQIIMLISEGIDYDYNPAELFKTFNREERYYTPVRVFTFLIGTVSSDAVQMQWIACANMGYYVNITLNSEIMEKVLKYLTVLSRPLNLNSEIKPEPIWTGTYVDLADRRLTNWLWNKHEGNLQRKLFVDYTKDVYEKYGCIFDNQSHFLNQTDHEYAKYLATQNFIYMTTVSLPVYDRRKGEPTVLGVAAVDVPITFIKKLTMPHRIGVNGYAFILTNNGLLLLHPDHRKEFRNIIKPTFNRVDLTEAELIDDDNEPRDFNKTLLEMREQIVNQKTGYAAFDVKTHLDNMKRIILSKRHYYYTKIGPFSLGIALPDNYGFYKIRHDEENSQDVFSNIQYLKRAKKWKIHPEWIYCKEYHEEERTTFATPEEELLYYLNKFQLGQLKSNKYCYQGLISSLLVDAKVTDWFEDYDSNRWGDLLEKYQVTVVFLATHSGLTRWKVGVHDEIEPEFIKTNNKAIDEVWYKRAVDYNYYNPKSFIYSVPFENKEDEELMITASNAIYRESGTKKTPVAVVGYQFSHSYLEYIFKIVTRECVNDRCQYSCFSKELRCFILDNNAYVIISNNESHIGQFIGNIRPDIMNHLVNESGIYRQTRFFDYQDICYIDPPKRKPPPKKKKVKVASPASKTTPFYTNVIHIFNWMLSTIAYFINSALGAANKDNPCLKAITSDYNERAIRKSLPTPCDQQRWLYNLDHTSYTSVKPNMYISEPCLWPYIVQPIPDTNLILLVINAECAVNTSTTYTYTPEPQQLSYNLSMPCYIATKNNYTRRQYITCINKHKGENDLNARDKKYCGITWD